MKTCRTKITYRNVKGRVKAVNVAWCDQLGREPEASMWRSVSELRVCCSWLREPLNPAGAKPFAHISLAPQQHHSSTSVQSLIFAPRQSVPDVASAPPSPPPHPPSRVGDQQVRRPVRSGTHRWASGPGQERPGLWPHRGDCGKRSFAGFLVKKNVVDTLGIKVQQVACLVICAAAATRTLTCSSIVYWKALCAMSCHQMSTTLQENVHDNRITCS